MEKVNPEDRVNADIYEDTRISMGNGRVLKGENVCGRKRRKILWMKTVNDGSRDRVNEKGGIENLR